MADPTMLSLEKILGSDEYEVIDNVPVLDEYRFLGKDGVEHNLDAATLEEIAATSNERLHKTGDLSPIGPGHTNPDPRANEQTQPPVYGYAGRYRVGRFGPSNKLAILSTWWIKKSCKEDFVKFPRRSVELWIADKVIDWIALLKRAPRRDLGMLTFAKDKAPVYTREIGDMAGKTDITNTETGGADPTQAPDKNEPPSTKMVDPNGTQPQAPEGVDPGFHDAFQKCMTHHFPHLTKMHGSYAEQNQAGPGSPSSSNTYTPGVSQKPKGLQHMSKEPEATPETKELERMEKESENVRFSRLEARLDAQQKENDELKLKYARAECERMVQALEYEGFQLDRPTEVEMLVKIPDADREKRIEHIRKYYKHDPTTSALPFLPDQIIQFHKNKPEEAPTNPKQHTEAIRMASKEGIDYDAALAKIKSKAV